MTWIRWAGAAGTVAAAALALGALSCTTSGAKSSSTTQNAAASAEDVIAHGHRITYTSGCQDCHTPGTFYGTPDMTRELSGSELGWTGPWGTSYPRNLTPDPETGIGNWTEDQIVTAIRTGHRPDGSPLLPPMPWPMYAHLNDDEAHAVAKFLKTLPPIKHQVPAVVPPGQKPKGPALVFPPPSEWDGRNLPAPSASATSEGGATAPATGGSTTH